MKMMGVSIMHDYCGDVAYFNYIMEQETARQTLNRYLQECVLLSEHAPISDIKVLNEGIGETVGNWAKKVKAFIAKLWAKFKGNLDILLKKNETFLSKYKDTILKKRVKRQWTVAGNPATAMKRLTEKLDFSTADTADELVGIADDGAIKYAAKFLDQGYKPDTKTESKTDLPGFSEYAKNYFYAYDDSKQTELGPSNIPMADMYNYCMEFKSKILITLENNRKKLESSIDDLLKTVGDYKEPENNADTTADGGNPPDGEKPETTGGTGEKPADTAKEEMAYYFGTEKAYSVVYETYITEEDKPLGGRAVQSKPLTQTSSGSNSGDDPTTVGANVQDLNKQSSNMFKDDKKNRNDALTKKGQESSETNEKIKSGLRIAQSVIMTIFSAQITVAQSLYNMFVKIMRDHCRDYFGNIDSGDDTSYNKTDYSDKNNNNKAEKNAAKGDETKTEEGKKTSTDEKKK